MHREITEGGISTYHRDGVVLLDSGRESNCEMPTNRSRLWDMQPVDCVAFNSRIMPVGRESWTMIENYGSLPPGGWVTICASSCVTA